MSELNKKAELFVELSNEQEEVISGGVNAFDALGTDFLQKQEALRLNFASASGPGGSLVTQNVVATTNVIDTSSFKDFGIDLTP
jgi:hypothetical protein